MAKKHENRPEKRFYGNAGASFAQDDFQYKDTAKSGALGERILAKKLDKWVPEGFSIFCSLRVPGKRSDVDFAIVAGGDVLLVDAKLFRQDGGFLWNMGSESKNIYRYLSPYTTAKGKRINLSRSMIMAKDIYSRHIKTAVKVEPIVVITNNPKTKNAKMPVTWALTYPGGVKVYNDRAAERYIRKWCEKRGRTKRTPIIERELKKLVQ